MRLVLRDTTMTRAQVANRRDKDVRSSHFERVTFATGCDFTGYDLRDATFYACAVPGAILPGHEIDGVAATDYLWSYKSDWAGAVFPANISVAHHQWVPEIVRQANVTAEKPFADYEGREREYTPQKALAEALRVHSPETLRTLVQEIFAPYPRLLKFIARTVREAPDAADVAATTEVTVQTTDIFFPSGPYAAATFARQDFPSNDRFEIAEWMGKTLSAQAKVPVSVHIHRLHPDMWVEATTNPDRWDWWRKWL